MLLTVSKFSNSLFTFRKKVLWETALYSRTMTLVDDNINFLIVFLFSSCAIDVSLTDKNTSHCVL